MGATAQVRMPVRQRPGRIEGQVLREPDEAPLRRAQVVLRPMEAGLTTIGVEADDQGNFATVSNVRSPLWTLLPHHLCLVDVSTAPEVKIRL